jgi:O-antigen ligase
VTQTAIGPAIHDVPAALRAGRRLAIVTVAWGALAFGAVYPWGYWPLAIAAQACGFLGLLAAGRTRVAFASRALVLAFCGVAAAGLLQVIPLPVGVLAAITPATIPVVSNIDFQLGAGLTAVHPSSIAPSATWAALALYGSFTVFLFGVTRLVSLQGAKRLVEGLTILAVVVALVGIVQKPLYAGSIYGFWEPETGGNPFGPFVNKNHFAGWMLMALPLTLALLCAGLEHGTRGVKPEWRYRILWLSSPEANRLILLASAAAVMALALVLTMSRSGISALALSLLMTGWFVVKGVRGRSRKAAGAAYLLLLVVTVVAWVGADVIVGHFSKADWSEFNNRRGAWADAVNVARTFPITGTGLNTYDTAARFYQRHDLENHFGESHNDYLQLAAEGGLLVGIPVVVCLGLFVRDVRRRLEEDEGTAAWWLRRGAVTALIAVALQETVEFSLQMPGNAALFALVCAIALHRRSTQRPPHDVRPGPVKFAAPVLAYNRRSAGI